MKQTGILAVDLEKINPKKEFTLQPTNEQQQIVDAIKDNKNVIVNAVAGSGKTTTIMHLLNQLPKDKKILVLMYNTKLKDDTKDRIDDYDFNENKNVEVYTIHGFATMMNMKRTYFEGKTVNKDDILEEFIYDDRTVDAKFTDYDIVILDELQDYTKLHFDLLKKVFVKSNRGKNPQWLVMGDNKQLIYDYSGADARYLTMFDQLVGSDKEFVRLPLNNCFRLQKNMIDFVNKYVLNSKEEGVLTYPEIKKDLIKNDNKITHIQVKHTGDGAYNQIVDIIKQIKEKGNYSNEDFLILSRNNLTTKNFTNAKMQSFVNALALEDIHIYEIKDEFKKRQAKNKIHFSTIQRAKGREAKNVILWNFDNGFWSQQPNKFGEYEDCNQANNLLYVASTRAKENLILVQFNRAIKKGNSFENERSLFNWIKSDEFYNDTNINHHVIVNDKQKQYGFDKLSKQISEQQNLNFQLTKSDKIFPFFLTGNKTDAMYLSYDINSKLSKQTNQIFKKDFIIEKIDEKHPDFLEEVTRKNTMTSLKKSVTITDTNTKQKHTFNTKHINNKFLTDVVLLKKQNKFDSWKIKDEFLNPKLITNEVINRYIFNSQNVGLSNVGLSEDFVDFLNEVNFYQLIDENNSLENIIEKIYMDIHDDKKPQIKMFENVFKYLTKKNLKDIVKIYQTLKISINNLQTKRHQMLFNSIINNALSTGDLTQLLSITKFDWTDNISDEQLLPIIKPLWNEIQNEVYDANLGVRYNQQQDAKLLQNVDTTTENTPHIKFIKFLKNDIFKNNFNKLTSGVISTVGIDVIATTLVDDKEMSEKKYTKKTVPTKFIVLGNAQKTQTRENEVRFEFGIEEKLKLAIMYYLLKINDFDLTNSKFELLDLYENVKQEFVLDDKVIDLVKQTILFLTSNNKERINDDDFIKINSFANPEIVNKSEFDILKDDDEDSPTPLDSKNTQKKETVTPVNLSNINMDW